MPTGKRRRQKTNERENDQDEEDVEDNNIEEEDRRSETTQSRRKLNRLATSGGRRKPTIHPAFSGTRAPPRRRVRPQPTDQAVLEQEETESPNFPQEEEEVVGPAIRVKTVSKVSFHGPGFPPQ